MPNFTFHLIANSHLDPVWLWDWREGINEGLITCRTVLDLMDEFPALTFVRGEAAVYEHIELTDPATFKRIVKYVRQGRWDPVGGTYVQADTNMPATETFARQYARGQQYFLSRFGRTAKVAWAADSFGHAAGLPEVMSQAGIKYFAFTRPEASVVPIAKPAFWWIGAGGSRVMAYRPSVGWYGNERNEIGSRLDSHLEAALAGDLENVGVFYGLGDHGGGPTRRLLRDIDAWAAEHKAQVRVEHSGLHRFFRALEGEMRQKGENFLPVHHGEMNFVLRGCYSSVARLKYFYRKTESLVQKVEASSSAIAAALGVPAPDLGEAQDAVLFNSFHDILPGTSIERACDEQIAHLGLAFRRAQQAELAVLNSLALQVDTQVAKPEDDMPAAVAALVFNPHPHPVQTHVELEANMDYRPIWQYKGRPQEMPLQLLDFERRPLPMQRVAVEYNYLLDVPWRARVVAPISLPPMSYSMLEFGYVEKPLLAAGPHHVAKAVGKSTIENRLYRIMARKGGSGVAVFYRGKRLFGRSGLSATIVEDTLGSWGQMQAQWDPKEARVELETLRVQDVRIIEKGPLRAVMWVKLGGQRSSVELTFSLCSERSAVDVSARVLWNERAARLQLVMPFSCEGGEYDVPGATVRRGLVGEVPGGRWVRVVGQRGKKLGWASDSIYGFECRGGEFLATVCRATRYSADQPAAAGEAPYIPAVDRGELKFRFMLTPGDEDLPMEAAMLEQPPTVLLVPAKPGKMARQGSLAELAPDTMKLLAFKPAADGKGYILRFQNMAKRTLTPRFKLLDQKLQLGAVEAGHIACWRLTHSRGRWTAKATDIVER